MLSDQEINIIVHAMKPFNPVKIGIFGSVARNESASGSDIDILYDFDSKYSLFDLGGLQVQLQEALKKEVDLVAFSHIHPLLKDRILSEVKIVYGG